MPASIAHSPMDGTWIVTPGGGGLSLTFTNKAHAEEARDCLNAGKPLPKLKVAYVAAAFIPSRSSKIVSDGVIRDRWVLPAWRGGVGSDRALLADRSVRGERR
ncbi:hypothetical protein sos41_31630 [Alphaproteobacteria bacterium SO-S41]|nr:hypothetical protein sos41_31630 [Alphaproteobacteria bacterium SO-S41]